VKILIAEDNHVSRKLLQKVLKEWGHEVLSAKNGQEAWNIFNENDVYLVVTDWEMPEMNGIELCRRIRESRAEEYVYIIILTAREDSQDVVEGLEAGADDFVTKPFNLDELKSRIKAGVRLLELEQKLNMKHRLLKEANNRIMKDLRAAAKIQKSLLPNDLPPIEGLNIFWEFFPCEQLGGDMLNIFRLDENHFGIYVLDVSGHGVSAALHSVSLSRILSEKQGIVKSITSEPPYYSIIPPSQVLKVLNGQFPMDSNTGQYFTIIYGILNFKEGTFCWSSGGHPLPIILEEGCARLSGIAGGPPIGFFENAFYKEELVKLKPRQRIILYSDGVPEAINHNDQYYTVERMIKLIESTRNLDLKNMLFELTSGVEKWTRRRGEASDDITILGLEVTV